MKMTIVGIDLEKKVMQVHGVGCAWQNGSEEAIETDSTGPVQYQPSALPDWHGGLR
jgi:hypothetical protein